ncbi:DNA mismatch repair protein MutL [Microstroma glucosiphilum]|uniref:DNA mismatch repair protein PMS1 n=1 Tax=Pseudomicrostroma glucosiphilum TaxID=1684307 RepID=A0A316U9E1_9BASI|nr:DNA mismatch repair protein MutL [Pseudomicrostroma glucosiphilum]PWN21887.1 DNA mismatch repair protein MutL [Pseudomicrostroma glucosiphilum]
MARFTPSTSTAVSSKAQRGGVEGTVSSDGSATRNGQSIDGSSAPPTQSAALPKPASSSSDRDRGGIRAIARTDVHRITSGQVVLDLSSAVKELVENALDAGATSLEIRFKNFGLDSLEVVDNGAGIKPEDYESVALKHHTSKIENFDDLNYVKTFGFRGEALSSLCALAEVTILTATLEEAPMGTVLEFAQDGSIADCTKRMARQRGSTATVNNLFHSLPVRRREMEKHCKREYGKAQALLQAYALISKGVRWNIVNITKEGRKNVALAVSSATGADWLSKNFASLFGAKAPVTLQALDIVLEIERPKTRKRDLAPQRSSAVKRRRREVNNSDEEDIGSDTGSDEEDGAGQGGQELNGKYQTVLIKGLISKPTKGSGRTSSDRQFLYINGRPWDSLKVTKAFNEIYRQFNGSQYPVVVADFTLPTDSYDVNVSPDKRTIFLHDEQQLVEALKTGLDNLFAPSRGTLAVNTSFMPSQAAAFTQQRLPFQRSSSAEEEGEEEEDDPLSPRRAEHAVSPEAEEDEAGEAEQQTSDPTLLPKRDADQPPEESDESEGEAEAVTSDSRTLSLFAQRQPVDRPPSRPSAAFSTYQSTSNPSENRNSADRTAASSLRDSSRFSTSSLSSRRAEPALHSKKGAPMTLSSRRGGLQSVLAGFVAPGSQRPSLSSDRRSDGEQEDQLTAEEIEALEYREDVAGSDESVEASPEAQPATEEGQGREMEEESTVDDPQALRSKHVSLPGDAADEDEDDRTRNLARLEASAAETHATEPVSVAETSAGIAHDSSGQVPVDMDALRAMVERRKRLAQKAAREAATRPVSSSSSVDDFSTAGLSNRDAQQVESELQRVITKSDFAHMTVLGQFNLGFIIARRRGETDGSDDLFIIDQHASDEKFNFETLQETTKIRSQRLIQPRLLELSASDELVAVQHVEAIRLNGFDIDIEEEGVAGSRIKLLALPVSKGTTFGVRDLEELLFLLRDVAPGSSKASGVRCSKVRAMFASRACRKSVMIGTALSARQMGGIVRQMGMIEQPWNCPHGRPTMRHLACLRALEKSRASEGRRQINWASLKTS